MNLDLLVVLSPLFKFLELRCFTKLRNYAINKLDRNQIGFVPNLGT